jgi:hypothetical protein
MPILSPTAKANVQVYPSNIVTNSVKSKEQITNQPDFVSHPQLFTAVIRPNDTAIVRLGRFLWDKYTDATIPQIQSVDHYDLRKWNMFIPLLIIFQGTFIGIFLYLCYNGYESNKSTSYLSPASNSHSSENCDSVPITITGTYLIDSSGYWQGDSNFSYENALYSLEMQSIALTSSGYEGILGDFESSLSSIGTKMSNRTLSWNLIAWASYSDIYSSSSGTIGISSLGDASNIFDVQYFDPGITSRNSHCLSSINEWSTSFDSSNSKISVDIPITLTYDMTGGVSFSEPCPGLFNASADFLFDPKYDSSLSIKFDSQSFSTAIAVNYGIKSFDTLSEVEVKTTHTGFYGLYFDSKYPGMDPIFCYSMESTDLASSPYVKSANAVNSPTIIASGDYPTTCLVRSGNQFFYPFFNHAGYTEGNSCWYSNMPCDPLASGELSCDANSHFIGLAFYSTEKGGLFSLVDLTNKLQYIIASNSTDGDIDVADKAQVAMAATVGINRWVKAIGNRALTDSFPSTSCPQKFTQTMLNGYDNILLNDEVSMLSIGMRQRDSDFTTSGKITMNKYSHLLTNAAYNNTLYKAAVFSAMVSPPTPLLQDYDICSMSEWKAFYNAIGVAYSNADLVAVFALFIGAFGIKMIINYLLVRDKSEHVIRPDRKLGAYVQSLNTLIQEIAKVTKAEKDPKIAKLIKLLTMHTIADPHDIVFDLDRIEHGNDRVTDLEDKEQA